MKFLTQGDYMFPFEAGFYWLKHFYIWSFQTGAANPDGIIRFPSRALNFLVFEATGNLGVSYFYVFFSFVVVFGAFYLFAKHFLVIEKRKIRLMGAALFAFNPIFLGYLAKVGLLVGVAMLPLCLVVLKLAFTTRHFRYFIIYALLLNISLIHPFNFTVNLLVSGVYGLHMLRSHGGFIKKEWLKMLGVIVVCLALYAYLLLPLGALGSVSRPEQFSEELGGEADYTTLVDFANARNPLTALSLSRNVFLDFGYYSHTYRPVYFVAAFILYLVLFGLYIYNEKRFKKSERQMFVVLMGAFIALVVLSIATLFGTDHIIKFLTGLPGGWIFRSPLKWQLYIPFTLAVMLCVLLRRTVRTSVRRISMITVAFTLMLMGAFLSFDIFRLLLMPRQFEQLSSMSRLDLDQKNLLLINNGDCFRFLQNNPRLVGEFNQIMLSSNVQVKRIKSTHAHTQNLGAYDYIFGCGSSVSYPLAGETRFERIQTFMDGRLELYQNREPRPYFYATDTVFGLDNTDNLNTKYTFVKDKLNQPFDFVSAKSAGDIPISGLQDPFENITPGDIQDDKILTRLWPIGNSPHQLISNSDDELFFRSEQNRLTFSNAPADNLRSFPEMYGLDRIYDHGIEFARLNRSYSYENLVPNASLEQGLWQKNVWDCYAYDDQPELGMALSDSEAADGHKSLELIGKRHIACTGPPEIPVNHGSRYLLSFRYKTPHPDAAWQISFDDPRRTSLSDRLPATGSTWREFAKEVEVPKHATRLNIKAQAVPGRHTARVFYDDFSLIEIPDLTGRLYLTDHTDRDPSTIKNVDVKHIDPTKKQVRISNVRNSFFLAMRDTYHDSWQATAGGHAIGLRNHLELNGFMNGWYIDIDKICGQGNCTENADGSFDIDMVIEFTPQRWFYKGLFISGITAAGVAGYFLFLGVRWATSGRGKYWHAD